MQNQKKKKVMAGLAVTLALALGAAGTLAYLTDNESHTNTFTVGDVKINLLERSWNPADSDGDGVPDAAEDLVPNQEVAKDPTVKNEGINDAVVFLRVTVPVKDVTRIGDDGSILNKDGTASNWTFVDADGDGVADTDPPHAPQEIFWLKDAEDAITLHANHFDENWIELTSKEVNNGAEQYVGERTYVFGYKTLLKGDKVGTVDGLTETAPLFDKVQLKNIIENEIAPDQIQNIKVETWAIQSDNVLNADGVINTTGDMDADTLGEIYDIFVNQNVTLSNNTDADDNVNGQNVDFNKYQDEEHGQVEKEADKNNTLNLKGDQNVGGKIAVAIDDSILAPTETGTVTITVPTIPTTAKNIKVTLVSADPTVASVPTTALGGADGFGTVAELNAALNTVTVTANKIGDTTLTATLTYDVPVIDKYDADGKAVMKDQAITAKASVHVSVEKDSRTVNGNVAANDADNQPIGTTEP